MKVAPHSRLEMSGSERFAPRVRRLVGISSVALGVIWWLATTTLDCPVWVSTVLAAGWILMPLLLAASLKSPSLRYLLALPALLVSIGLIAILGLGLPEGPPAWVGWILITAGIEVGGVLGLWFWYRLLPVSDAFDDPFDMNRWGLIALHAGLVIVGIVLVLIG